MGAIREPSAQAQTVGWRPPGAGRGRRGDRWSKGAHFRFREGRVLGSRCAAWRPGGTGRWPREGTSRGVAVLGEVAGVSPRPGCRFTVFTPLKPTTARCTSKKSRPTT